MKAPKVAAVAIALAFGIAPASAAVIMNYSGTTRHECISYETCYATAHVDFKLPTLDYILPTLGAGPLASTPPLPPRYTYRIVISAPGPVIETVSEQYYKSEDWYYYYPNGTFSHIVRDGEPFDYYSDCYALDFCTPNGYAQGNQAIFQFEDGIIGPSSFVKSLYPAGFYGNVLIGYTGTVSVSAFLDPSQADLPFTAQVFQFGAVPEPSTWIMLILGFGMCGAILRCQRKGLNQRLTGRA